MNLNSSYCIKCKRKSAVLQENQICNYCNDEVSAFGQMTIEDYNRKQYEKYKAEDFVSIHPGTQQIINELREYLNSSESGTIGSGIGATTTTNTSDPTWNISPPATTIIGADDDMFNAIALAIPDDQSVGVDTVDMVFSVQGELAGERRTRESRERQKLLDIWRSYNPTVLHPYSIGSNSSGFITWEPEIKAPPKPGVRSYKGKRKKKKKKNIYERIKRNALNARR